MDSHFCLPCGSMLSILDNGEVECTLCAFKCGIKGESAGNRGGGGRGGVVFNCALSLALVPS
jgi:DNA-directed RNA polymerase subunit RPC12/RpoP